jgi:imidazolonepropionase-like amidohydrolase
MPSFSVRRLPGAAGTLLLGAGLAVAQSGEIAITHVTIVDPGASQPQRDMTIIIRGREIASVGPAGSLKSGSAVRVIDGTGEFVIPGLWDMHSHFRDAPRDLKMDVANGVLGIRDMGGAAAEVFPLRDAIARGEKLGPKIIACGPILDGPDSWSIRSSPSP